MLRDVILRVQQPVFVKHLIDIHKLLLDTLHFALGLSFCAQVELSTKLFVYFRRWYHERRYEGIDEAHCAAV